jgi:hypothetical protein
MNIEPARFNMIEQQIRPWDVLAGPVPPLPSVAPRLVGFADANRFAF